MLKFLIMVSLKDISVPAQARDIYKLLLDKGNLNANQIGRKLDIFPNAVYRSTETLKKLGCISESKSYPVVYHATPPNQSVEKFLLLSREGFLSTFSYKNITADANSSPNISFIKDRETLLNKYADYAKSAQKQINLIISGHELPPFVYIENLKAVRRGVVVRAIIQNYEKSNTLEIQDWKDSGLQVRYLPTVDLRLVIIDNKIVQIMSYNSKESLSSMGIEFSYRPLAQVMIGVFEEKWQESIII